MKMFTFFSKKFNRRIILTYAFISFSIGSFLSQTVVAEPSIHSPLGMDLKLNAVFGDLRSNHFHTGLDFGTNGKINIPIYAIRKGFVSRIKISPTGYGKVLYIDHPNGQTSVYAHCNKFAPKIDSFCISLQEHLQINELDTLLQKNLLQVEFGEIIAFSGNTGNSSGPHLHFEIRNTDTEKPLNPLNHGFKLLGDSYSPILQEIRIYALNEQGYIIPNKVFTRKILQVGTTFKIDAPIQIPDNFIASSESIGIAFRAYDKIKANNSQFGIYGAKLMVSNKENYSFEMDTLDFSYSRYINEHIDFEYYKKNKIRFHKLFRNQVNEFELYKGNGWIKFDKNQKLNIDIEVFDQDGNKSEINLSFIAPKIFNPKATNFPISTFYLPNDNINIQQGNYSLSAPQLTILQPIKKDRFFSNLNPFYKSITIEYPQKNDETNKSYIKIDGIDHQTTCNENKLVTNTKALGKLSISKDENPPVVSPLNFTNYNMNNNYLEFKIYDSETAVKNYNLYIDEKWTRVFYDKKKRKIISDTIEKNKSFNVKLIVNDLYGNATVFKSDVKP